MSYGFATHLWILGRPTPAILQHWLRAAKPDVREEDVVVFELGNRTLVAAVNTNDHNARWRSIEIVNALAAQVQGFEWVAVDVQPDHDDWRIETSAGQRPRSVEQAKTIIRELVPLELNELHHYVDWAQALEETTDGAPAPAMPDVSVRHLGADLPSAPRPKPRVSAVAWVLIGLCLAASAFTVSMVQSAGPAAFKSRFLHFVIEGGVFWAMVFAGAREYAGTVSGRRLFGMGALAILGAGLLWGLLPI